MVFEDIPVRKLLKYTIGAGALGLYIKDCYEVYSVLKGHNEEVDAHFDEEELKRLEKLYNPEQNIKEFMVDSASFKRELAKLGDEIKDKDPNLGIAPDNLDFGYQIPRESILFLGGGRAALLQLAHPYVAAGVAQHSSLKTLGVQERFYNTFKHVFALTYGDIQKVYRSSKIVRSLHQKVEGEIGEDVGAYRAGSKYSANNIHALYWVYATLVEGAILMYEMYVRRLSVEEKNQYVKGSQVLAQTFGIPKEFCADTWDQFLKQFSTMLHSPYLAVSKDGKMITKFLWTPPAPRFAPLMNLVEWSTAVKLPSRISEAFYHRRIHRLDILVWSLINGFTRFVYRLLPGSVRWLTPYLKLRQRLGAQYNPLQKVMMQTSELFANTFLEQVMPPRPLDEKPVQA